MTIRTPREPRSRRTCLTVPGSSERMVAKAVGLDADEVVLDLEDAVAPEAKAAARSAVARALTGSDWGRRVRAVRVNDPSTPWTLRDLSVVVREAGSALDVVVLPKVNDAGQIAFVDTVLGQLEAEHDLPLGRIGIEVQIEDARGLIRIDALLGASARLEAVVFGPGDMAAALGMPSLTVGEGAPTYPGDPWHHVLFTVLVHARRYGLQAIDGPYARIRDLDGLRSSAARSRALGFDGKWVLHPDQIAPVNETYSVDPAEFERACDILDAYGHAVGGERRGAATFGAEMIDEATRKMAEANRARGIAQGLTVRATPDDVPFEDRARWRESNTS